MRSPNADWNQACSVEVWLTTISMMMRIPRRWASFSSCSKSCIVPKSGLIA
ncbi:Uncharacterised protein [Vibrio cholerae]|nr:Uncharacterised protein [Vibrio cholerae]